jgi:hypothetical protein
MPPPAPTNQASAGNILSCHSNQPRKTNRAPGSTHRRSIARCISRHATSCRRCRSQCLRPSPRARALICLSSAFMSHHQGGARRWCCHASNETAVHGAVPCRVRGRLLRRVRGRRLRRGRGLRLRRAVRRWWGSRLSASFLRSCVLPGPSTWIRTGGVSSFALAFSAVVRCLTTTLLRASKAAFSAGCSLGLKERFDHMMLLVGWRVLGALTLKRASGEIL